MAKRTKTIVLLILSLCVLCLSVGIAFAYYKKVEKGWGHTISTTSVVFQMNGKNYLDEISSDAFNLSRGEEKTLSLEVQVVSNNTFQISYNISFGLEQGVNNNFAEAVEVYEYIDGEYQFAYMLSDIQNHIISGNMYTNSPQTHVLKLVYSPEASNYYDGETFTLSAIGNVVLGQDENVYIVGSNDSERSQSFKNILEASENAGKTLVLNSDITTTDAINCNSNIGLDLNGHKLTLGGDLSINYSTVASENLGIISSREGGNIVFSNYNLNLNTSDAYRLLDTLDQSKINISFSQSLMSDLANDISDNFEKTSEKKAVLVSGDVISAFSNYKAYFAKGVNYSVANDSLGYIEISDSGSDIYDIRVKSLENTQNCNVDISFSYLDGQTSYTSRINESIIVRGSTVEAIANALANEIPSIIKGNLYLKNFDRTTDSTISWFVEDGLENAVLTDQGTFLPNGYEDLSSWTDKPVEIYIVVDNGGEKYVKYLSRTCELLSLEDRTQLFYDFASPSLSIDEGYNTYDLSSSINSQIAEKTGLTSYSIELDSTSNRLDAVNNYLSVNGSIVSVLNTPGSDRAIKVLSNVSFVFSDRVPLENEYVVEDKEIVVIGQSSSYEAVSVQNLLQRNFDVNQFVSGDGFTFDATAYLSTGVFVEYEVDAEYESYILVQNDFFERDYSGSFLLQDDNYIYFSRRSKVEVGEGSGIYAYEPDDNGAYIYIDSTNVLRYDDYREQVYNLRSQFTLLPSKMPKVSETATVKAYLFDYDENGDKVYRTEQVVSGGETITQRLCYSLTLGIDGIYQNDNTGIPDYYLYSALLEYYDANDDGEIQVSESQMHWTSINVGGETYKIVGTPSVNFASGAVYSNGELVNASLSERYKTLSSVDKGNGDVYYYIDVSNVKLSNLTGVEYFTYAEGYSFDDNLIIDLSQLQNLSQIVYLSLANNLISSIQAISYFDALEYIDVSNCQISNILPLKYLENLIYVNVSQNVNLVGFEAFEDDKNIREINVIGVNSIYQESSYYYFNMVYSNNANANIQISSGTAYARNQTFILAARALSQLKEIYNIYEYFYAPKDIFYGGETYTLKWETSHPSSISVAVDIDNNELVEKNHYVWNIVSPSVNKRIEIYVSVIDSNGDKIGTMSNSFDVVLLNNPSVIAEIQTTSGGLYQNALTVIPDKQLLNALFEMFDTNNDDKISYEELSTQYVNENVDLRNLKITDLTGIEYFVDALNGRNLFLTGNVIDDLTPISYLSGLTGIRLDGNEYDFNQLVNAPQGTLSSLRYLELYGCYNLDNYQVLEGIYSVYIKNTAVNIYLVGLDNSYDRISDINNLRWNPYEFELPKKVQSLVSYHNFDRLGETLSICDGSIAMEFYGTTLDFYITAKEFSVAGEKTTTNTSPKGFFTLSGTTITYQTMVGVDETIYLRLTISANDGRVAAGSYNVVYNKYCIELNAKFYSKIYLVQEVEGETTFTSLADIFYGRSVRNFLYKGLSNNVFVAANLKTFSGNITTANIDNGYYYDSATESYYITEATLAEKMPNPSDSYTLQGTKPSSPYLIIDGSCVPGAEVLNKNAISGLKYLPTVKKIYFSRDADVGTGVDLYNVRELYIRYSALDLTELCTVCPNLEVFDMSASAGPYSILGRGNDCYLKYFPNVSTVNLIFAAISDWTFFDYYNTDEGINLIRDHISSNPLATVKIYSGNSTTNYNNNSATTKNIFDGIYDTYYQYKNAYPSFYIGTQSSKTNSSTVYSKSWSSDIISYQVTELTEYQAVKDYIFDLGLKVNDEYSFKLSSDKVYENDVISLPSSTSNEFFGTEYNNDKYFDRDFPISWQLYSISQMGALPTPTTVSNSYTVSNNSGMLVFVGTIGHTITHATPQYYFYEFLANDSTNQTTFGKYKDSALRLYLYCEGITNNDLSIALTSASGVYNSVLTKFNIPSIKNVAASTVSGTTRSYSTLSITSLDGIEDFSLITSLTVTNQALIDVSAISSLTTLNSVDLSNNLISDVSVFSELELSSLNLENNKIYSLESWESSNLVATLETLNLNYNARLLPNELSNLENSSSLLTSLGVYKTLISNSFEGIEAVYGLMTANNIASFSISINDSSFSTITSAILLNFITDINAFSLPSVLTTSGTYVPNLTTYNYTISSGYVDKANLLGNEILIKVEFSLDGSTQLVNIVVEKLFTQIGSVQSKIITNYGDLNISDLDLSLFVYLISYPKSDDPSESIQFLRSNSNNNYEINTSYTSLRITENLGITSLKNLNKLGFASIDISLNPIKELWTTPYTELTSLRLSDATLNASIVYNAISSSSNLASLNLAGSFGIDYSSIVSGQNSLQSVLDNMSRLTTLQINNEYNLFRFGGLSLREAIINNLNGYSSKYTSLNVFKNCSSNGNTYSALDIDKAFNVKLAISDATRFNVFGFNSKSVVEGGNIICSESIMRVVANLSTTNRQPSGNSWYSIPGSSDEQSVTIALEQIANGMLTLPKYVNIFGTQYNINWTVSEVIDTSNNSIANAVWLNPSEEVVHADTTKSVKSFKLTANCFGSSGSVNVRTGGTQSATDYMNYYFQTDELGNFIDENNEIYFANDNNNEVITLYAITEGASVEYYHDNPGSEATEIYAVKAGDIINSGRFLSYIFHHSTITNRKWDPNLVKHTCYQEVNQSTINGYIMLRDNILGVRNFDTNTDKTDTSFGNSSIQGIQIFKNAVAVGFISGCFVDLKPISDLNLQSFVYLNSQNTFLPDNYHVYDFTPLVNGSKTTLKTFVYNSIGGTTIDDLSFLLSFTQLQEVQLFTRTDTTQLRSGKAMQEYIETNSFKYVVCQLIDKGVKVCVGNSSSTQAFKWDYSSWEHEASPSTKVIYGASVSESEGVVSVTNARYTSIYSYQLIANKDYDRASDVLSLYSTCDISGISMRDNYELVVSSGNYIPAYINDNGLLYALKYFGDCSTLSYSDNSSGYRLVGSGIQVNGTTYLPNEYLTFAQTQEILNSLQFLIANNRGECNIVFEVDFSGYNSTKLVARATLDDGYDYERMITITNVQ